jgi:hypothetical protein
VCGRAAWIGRRIGATFQWLRKYENGTNRIGAGKLTPIP